jgi:putative membrane-bound dehydrogenase-like protein
MLTIETNPDGDELMHRIRPAFVLTALTAALALTLAAASAPAQAAAANKPVYQSTLVSAGTPGHAVDIEADVTGAKQLYLVVTDGGDGFACDWADWVEPRLLDASGKETKLTELKWKSAIAGYGSVNVNKRSDGREAIKVNGKEAAFGIGTHANSVIAYDLPAGHHFTKFKARGGVDEGGTNQGCGSTVQFLVFTAAPPPIFASAAKNRGGGGGLAPEPELEALDVNPDLQAELFASEPLLLSPSNIDIDHRGRVWVCEIVNYRSHQHDRPEGDRILILEDTDHDGKADKQTVFYQGTDINSPHGVCVLATPDFKGTRVIVSAGDKVQNFYDDDGDGKADRKDTLFSGISGVQHDHGIHQFMFGPDGKLYFNFGNAGQQIKDKDGKPIIDMAGNEVAAQRKPYQDGMVFRCNLDGSQFETLGWNFRNDWMVTVDSFGTLWQSDNDDDGNKGVRITYVMEYGNYGYKDEMTGAGWQSKRPNLEPEIPRRHWHLNDPGVVPTLLLTGAGSPTGIVVYEGDLLPSVFHNQMIHTDAGPNIVRCYPVKKDGAGYEADIVNILQGARDKWFRPVDVKPAPDGSLIVADWYDPGVGGHGMRDMDRGRLFRVTPKGHKGYNVPKFDFSTTEGAITALKSPTVGVRQVAWQTLHGLGVKAVPALTAMAKDDNPRFRARALWLLAAVPASGVDYVEKAVDLAAGDSSDDLRGMALRLLRHHGRDAAPLVKKLAHDPSAQVRRECAIAIRDMSQRSKPDEARAAELAELWAELAMQHDGKDRWYLEALGIGADRIWDEAFAAWLKKAGGADKAAATAAGRDIVWRARCTAALPILAKIIASPDTPADQKDRYVRALDFHPKSPEKDKALQAILGL